ncbi:MAG: GyrI-like domain-containing protein [Clostridia bacterium]|nr:GyrI-like domain-containing protein [Clostridia bacterium]
MAFDYKKEFKEFYLPPRKPQIVEIPEMHFVAVRGSGNPNTEGGEYKSAMQLLYGVAFTIKMSKLGDHRIEGYFDYVVPPLEGLWWQEGESALDLAHKEHFQWINMIRLPEFVTRQEFDWAVAEAARKKGLDFSRAEYFHYDEGRCVQCMHVGPYDAEGATIAAMLDFAAKNGFAPDCGDVRRHHEIYLSDTRKCAPERLKTVIRIPVREK